mgnify:CR=1 FL=1
MLKPDSDRVDYGEELVPPVGYTLTKAIGCTSDLWTVIMNIIQ